MIILTRHKAKIGQTLTYPIGAEKLSAAIGDLPQAAEMAISFLAPSRFRQAPWRFSDRPYDVLEFRYSKVHSGLSTPRRWDESGHSGSPWEIWVSAVPKETVTNIKASLDIELMESVRPWLLSHNNSSKIEGSSSICFLYDPIEQHLTKHVIENLLPVPSRR